MVKSVGVEVITVVSLLSWPTDARGPCSAGDIYDSSFLAIVFFRRLSVSFSPHS